MKPFDWPIPLNTVFVQEYSAQIQKSSISSFVISGRVSAMRTGRGGQQQVHGPVPSLLVVGMQADRPEKEQGGFIISSLFSGSSPRHACRADILMHKKFAREIPGVKSRFVRKKIAGLQSQ